MGRYSIKELEALTGIKAHTIRIWEKRHQLIEPQRSETNIRFYSDDDLKKILNVSILYNQGYKISKIANLSRIEIQERISEISEADKPENEVFIDQLTISMVEMDEHKFEGIINDCIKKYGFYESMSEVVYPFLRKIGILWLSNNINPAQEHFMSNLIRQKIIVAIDQIHEAPESDAKTVMLFLPEDEMHEIGLLFFHYMIKKKGYRTFYLGQNVPFPDLKKSVEMVNADIIVGIVSYINSEKQLEDFLAIMDETFGDKQILLSGKPVFDRKDAIPESIELFETPQELDEIL